MSPARTKVAAFAAAGGFGVKAGQLSLVLYGLVLLLFGVAEPHGLASILTRIRARLSTLFTR